MTDNEYLTEWKQLLWRYNDSPCDLPEEPEVGFMPDIIDKMYSELHELKGKDVVHFIPSDNDAELLNANTFAEPMIVGTLADITDCKDVSERFNIHLYAKVDIFEKYRTTLPFRGYALHIGLDSDCNRFDGKLEHRNGKTTHRLVDCKVKGLYFSELHNHNHMFGKNGLFAYYRRRMQNMFVYVPGHCYW